MRTKGRSKIVKLFMKLLSLHSLRYQKEEAGLLRIRQNIDGLKEREKEIRKELKGLDQMKSTVTSDVKILKEQLGKLTSAQSNKEKMAKERPDSAAAHSEQTFSLGGLPQVNVAKMPCSRKVPKYLKQRSFFSMLTSSSCNKLPVNT